MRLLTLSALMKDDKASASWGKWQFKRRKRNRTDPLDGLAKLAKPFFFPKVFSPDGHIRAADLGSVPCWHVWLVCLCAVQTGKQKHNISKRQRRVIALHSLQIGRFCPSNSFGSVIISTNKHIKKTPKEQCTMDLSLIECCNTTAVPHSC